jgi:hypothetical protein
MVEALGGPREEVWSGGRLREWAVHGTHRGGVQADGGDCRGPNSDAGTGCGNQCAAQGGSSSAREAATGVNWFKTLAERGAHRVAPMADGGACTALERGKREAFIAGSRRLGVPCAPRPWGQGMGGGTASTAMYGQWRASASGPMAARRCAGQRLKGTRVAPAYCLDRVTRTLPQWARHPARTDGRRRASACAHQATGRPVWISFGSVWTNFSPNFWTEVVQAINRKFVDQSTLYNFYKGRMAFFSTICAQFACQAEISWAQVNSNQECWLEFFIYLNFKSPMQLNMKVVSLDKTHNFYIGRFWSV